MFVQLGQTSLIKREYTIKKIQYYRKFYLAFPDKQIVNACVHNLNWTHFRTLLLVPDENARMWYINGALKNN